MALLIVTGLSPLTLQSALVPQGLGWQGLVLTGAWRDTPMLFEPRRLGIETGLKILKSHSGLPYEDPANVSFVQCGRLVALYPLLNKIGF